MNDLISRQAVLEKIHWLGLDNDTAIKCDLAICALPSVNPQPKTGKWIYQEGYVPYKWKCNQCSVEFKTDFNYCPNCGAKMESKVEQ